LEGSKKGGRVVDGEGSGSGRLGMGMGADEEKVVEGTDGFG